MYYRYGIIIIDASQEDIAQLASGGVVLDVL
jgi:hypothetical protein